MNLSTRTAGTPFLFILRTVPCLYPHLLQTHWILRRATDAQVLPSRRPAYSGNLVSEYSVAAGTGGARYVVTAIADFDSVRLGMDKPRCFFYRASEDATTRFSRPRLAANFANRPEDETTGGLRRFRTWFWCSLHIRFLLKAFAEEEDF